MNMSVLLGIKPRARSAQKRWPNNPNLNTCIYYSVYKKAESFQFEMTETYCVVMQYIRIAIYRSFAVAFTSNCITNVHKINLN